MLDYYPWPWTGGLCKEIVWQYRYLILESMDCEIVTRDLVSLGLWTITGTLTGLLESLDYGSLTGVVAVFATSAPVGDLLWMELQARCLAARGVHMWHTEPEGADQRHRNN